MARLWYPVAADPPRLADAPWIERADVVLPTMAGRGGLPSFAFGHLALVRTHATWAAPPAPAPTTGGWPLVTFAHGLGGFRSQNTFLAEDLASHGVVVAALDHPGDALGTTLPDGSTLPYVGLPPSGAPGYADAVAALGARWTADSLALLRTLGDLLPVGDLAPFAGALDLGRVVAAGHSTGGGVAVEVCHAWDGCVAALALDPWWGPVDPARLQLGSERPLVVIDSDPALAYFSPTNGDRFARFVNASAAPVLAFVLEGGGHHDVNDTMHLAPSWLALRFGHSVGPVDKDAGMAAMREVARSWVAAAGEGRIAEGMAAVEAAAGAPLRFERASAAR
jgi:dienelactone hydrolase